MSFHEYEELGKKRNDRRKTITGANYFCERCRAWYRLICGTRKPREDAKNAEANQN